jgi:putative two-component system response regulator
LAQKHTVLVVDDERDITLLVADHLGSEGYTVRVAHSADEAIAAIEAKPPDLVVTDVRMPGGSGMDVLAHVKRLDEILPVILLTAQADVTTAVEALRRQADDFLDKPLNFDRLSLAVERALERHELRLMDRRYQAELELAVEEKTGRLRRALSDLQAVSNSTVEVIASFIEVRDCETQHHCRRAREYTIMLANRLGVRGKALQDLGWGSLLHDVGKIGVPDHILLKKGRLDAAEWEEMRKHPLIGFRLLCRCPA